MGCGGTNVAGDPTRPLLSNSGGGGGVKSTPGFWLTHPPQKILPQEKNESYQKGPEIGGQFLVHKPFLASDPPPSV